LLDAFQQLWPPPQLLQLVAQLGTYKLAGAQVAKQRLPQRSVGVLAHRLARIGHRIQHEHIQLLICLVDGRLCIL
jgi:hypothetical protein